MSTLSTSGIVGVIALPDAPGGFAAEAAILIFLVFALSRATFSTDLGRGQPIPLWRDRELRIAGLITLAVTLLLFARHWIGAFEVAAATDLRPALAALWGGAFTTVSYLTTTGFVSAEWEAARAWSGLGATQVLLLGLAMFGGGVATTAGGVKLLRIYALYAHGRREMQLLVHPHSIASERRRYRITQAGIEAAWVFFMLFAVTIALVTLGLAMTGLRFETALTLAIAGLSTTGPLAEGAFPPGQGALTLPDAAKVIYAAAMVIGRLEAVALIALFNPAFWRR
jgi:trk system potassium uptake protein TrkH